ncbi:hypothetical protein CKAH01_16588 [Colletotrichum kahawae]|uniref:Uncharacterized protein n=1 Tax=Colletotrichum kahawae TaxID=34407 RepID=A0AAE0D6K6_COLKA|nr:hypothetical protein CKAH01_16588 [Colletotrichum kahawae]
MEPEPDDLISFCSGPKSPLGTDVNSCPTAPEKHYPTSFGEGVTKPLSTPQELERLELEADEKRLEPTAGHDFNALENSIPFIEGTIKSLPPLHDLEDLELEKLSQLCLPRWDSREIWRQESSAIRPERFEYAALLRKPPSLAWKRAMQQLHSGFYHGRPLEETIPFSEPYINRPFLGAMSIILYDIQLQKESQADILPDVELRLQYNSKMSTWRDLILMHMLLVDYGMVAPPMRVHDSFSDKTHNTNDTWKRDWPVWNALCAVVSEIAQSCAHGRPDKVLIWYISDSLRELAYISPVERVTFSGFHFEYDLALMLHHYHTRRKSLPPEEYWKGRTGYQGILQELIDDVPRLGTERLTRKLSVDFNENIEAFISSDATQKTVKEIVKGVAARLGIELAAPKERGLGTPLIELYYKNGVLKREGNPYRTR